MTENSENKLFSFNLVIQEKDGKKVKVGEKQQEIKIIWKKHKSGLITGQPASSEVIQFEKDGKKYDIEVKELILNKGLFKDRITHVAFAPDLRLIPHRVPYSEYPPYHVYNLNPAETKNRVKLLSSWKTGRLIGVGILSLVSLGLLLLCLVKFLKKKKNKKTQPSF